MEELIEYEQLPVIPLRGMVAFPEATMHFDVGGGESVARSTGAGDGSAGCFWSLRRSLMTDDPRL